MFVQYRRFLDSKENPSIFHKFSFFYFLVQRFSAQKEEKTNDFFLINQETISYGRGQELLFRGTGEKESVVPTNSSVAQTCLQKGHVCVTFAKNWFCLLKFFLFHGIAEKQLSFCQILRCGKVTITKQRFLFFRLFVEMVFHEWAPMSIEAVFTYLFFLVCETTISKPHRK